MSKINKFRYSTTPNRPTYQGFYKARVEQNQDNLGIGRIQIRIPQFHGVPGYDDNYIEPEDLPWAYPCMPLGAGYDHGSYIIPEVGEYVWIVFEAGDPEKPVYVGSSYGRDATSAKPMGSMTDEFSDSFLGSQGKWYAPAFSNEVPKDVDKTTKRIIYKSVKGTTIAIDDSDEEESLELIDRLGQVFKLIGPMDIENNTGNANPRGTRTAEDDTNYNVEEFSFLKKAVILLKGANHQLLRMVSLATTTISEFVSRFKENYAGVVATSSEESSSTKIFSKSNKRIAELVISDSCGVTIKDSEGNVLVKLFMSSEGDIIIKGAKIKLESDDITFSSTPKVVPEEFKVETDNSPAWVDNNYEKYVEEVVEDDL